MTLSDTGKAIGAVTQVLHDGLINSLGQVIRDVTVGRPEPPTNQATNPRVNLFLYELRFDASLKNLPLDDGQAPPLWLVLKYLMTAFDKDGESDTIEAHEHLGEAMRVLQGMSFLPLHNTGIAPLVDNPETLKVTFDESPPDLLSKLMQGPDEKYRFSVCFEVRPILIAPDEMPSYSLLVGMDYTQDPVKIIAENGVKIPVTPSLGPTLTDLSPSKVEVNSNLTLFGSDLNLSGVEPYLGEVKLPVIERHFDRLVCLVDGEIAVGNKISAGSQEVLVVQPLDGNKTTSSNPLVVGLLPSLTEATPNSLATADQKIYGNIDLKGILLGTDKDAVFIGLYSKGRTVKAFDKLGDVRPPPTPPVAPQTLRRLSIAEDDAIAAGDYRVILRINGQQARNSPQVNLAA